MTTQHTLPGYLFEDDWFNIYIYIYIYIYDRWVHSTGTLDGLVGSHTRLGIYPTLTIHC